MLPMAFRLKILVRLRIFNPSGLKQLIFQRLCGLSGNHATAVPWGLRACIAGCYLMTALNSILFLIAAFSIMLAAFSCLRALQARRG